MIADGKCWPEKLIGINVDIRSDCRILNYYIYLRRTIIMPKHIDSLKGKNIVRAICEISSCDGIAKGADPNLIPDSDKHFS